GPLVQRPDPVDVVAVLVLGEGPGGRPAVREGPGVVGAVLAHSGDGTGERSDSTRTGDRVAEGVATADERAGDDGAGRDRVPLGVAAQPDRVRQPVRADAAVAPGRYPFRDVGDRGDAAARVGQITGRRVREQLTGQCAQQLDRGRVVRARGVEVVD